MSITEPDTSSNDGRAPASRDDATPDAGSTTATGTRGVDWPVLLLSGGALVAFVVFALIDLDGVGAFVDTTFGWSADYFGAFWQILLLLTFLIAIGMAVSRLGKVRLGAMSSPDFGYVKWISMIMCTLLAGGGVFWAAAEPMFHFTDGLPTFPGVEPATAEAAGPALAQSFVHWGFLAWAILGTLSTIVLMYGAYDRGLPLRPRTLLWPLLGDRVIHGPIGTLVDAFSIIAVAAGTIGPIGFLGLQAGYGLEQIWGVPNTFLTQLLIVAGLLGIVIVSAVLGLSRGIQNLSRFNVALAGLLGLFVFLVGTPLFVFESWVEASGIYVQDFFGLTLYRGDEGWLGFWTVFFFGWFLGYGPMMAIFIARISRGRTIRQLVLGVAVTAPVVTTVWFAMLGGTGIGLELGSPGIVSDALETAGLPAAMVSISQSVPLAALIAPLFILLTVTFVATTGDSMSYTIAMAVTGDESPRTSLRVFWAVTMGAVAVVLIALGEGGIDALQSFIVVTAVPVSLILLPTLWMAPQVARRMAVAQLGAVPEGDGTTVDEAGAEAVEAEVTGNGASPTTSAHDGAAAEAPAPRSASHGQDEEDRR